MENEATTKTPITTTGFRLLSSVFCLLCSVSCLLPSVSCLLPYPPIQPSLPRIHESIMQNKANFKIGNINISITRTKAYANESASGGNNEQRTLSKTKPIKPNSPAPLLRRERIQNLGAKRISRFIGPASKIENLVSRIKHLPHFAVHSRLHYAKQSQCQNGQYNHKYSSNKPLSQ